MNLLVLGGTQFLGRHVAQIALARGHDVTCLARGDSGPVAHGARLLAVDRWTVHPYEDAVGREWDAVIELSWEPTFVRSALEALAVRSRHWIYVSSCSVYADTTTVGVDESGVLVAPLHDDIAEQATYGPAKVACESACLESIESRLMIVRPGLIGGPGDPSDRAGYWVARSARARDEPMLVPFEQECPTQVIDVRDLAGWLVDSVETARTGIFNAVGEVQPFSAWLETSRIVGGHTGDVVALAGAWLVDQGVDWFMGPDSIALCLPNPDAYGFASRSGGAARAQGLRTRPLINFMGDVLVDEQARGLDRPRSAGLSPARERALLAAARAERHLDTGQ